MNTLTLFLIFHRVKEKAVVIEMFVITTVCIREASFVETDALTALRKKSRCIKDAKAMTSFPATSFLQKLFSIQTFKFVHVIYSIKIDLALPILSFRSYKASERKINPAGIYFMVKCVCKIE